MSDLPTFADVVAAAGRLQGHAHATPVLRSATLDARLGAEVFFKCENFQRMGAFKFRGAYNALARFTPAAAQGRRDRLLVGQPRAGHRAVGAHAGHAGGDRDAAGRTGVQAGATRGYQQGRPAARWCCTTATPKTARPSAGALPPSVA
jgi:hypothetical protein